MAESTGPKILGVVDYVSDGSTWGDEGRLFTRMWQSLIQPNVINMTTSAAPASPVNGDMYVVAATGSGAWVGKTNYVAYWTTADPDNPSGSWDFWAPTHGWHVWNQADDTQYYYNGVTWVAVSGVPAFSTAGQGAFWGLDPFFGTPNAGTVAADVDSTANKIRVTQLQVRSNYTIRKVSAFVSGNTGSSTFFCAAIYDANGNKVLDCGTNAFSTQNNLVLLTNSITPVSLTAGFYFFAWGGTANSSGSIAQGFSLGTTNCADIVNAGSVVRYGSATNVITAGVMPTTLGALVAVTGSTINIPGVLFQV